MNQLFAIVFENISVDSTLITPVLLLYNIGEVLDILPLISVLLVPVYCITPLLAASLAYVKLPNPLRLLTLIPCRICELDTTAILLTVTTVLLCATVIFDVVEFAVTFA